MAWWLMVENLCGLKNYLVTMVAYTKMNHKAFKKNSNYQNILSRASNKLTLVNRLETSSFGRDMKADNVQ